MLTKQEQKQKDYYNSIAKEYDNYQMSPYARQYKANVYDKAFINIPLKGAKVLDAMCGGGEATEYFLSKGSIVTGLDISEECCEIYKKRHQNNEIVCSSILSTKFQDNYFDIIVTDSLHHIHPHLNKGIAEIIRILKPNGYFHCWEPSEGSILDLARRIWYKLDNKFFMENEKSINIDRMNEKHKPKLKLIDKTYGGSIAYLLVIHAMPLRIPLSIVRVYAKFFMKVEDKIAYFHNRFFSCWVGALFQRK